MATKKQTGSNVKELSIEDKLRLLYKLQLFDSELDELRILRGELPLEVEDLEDEIQGLVTRIENFNERLLTIESTIAEYKNKIAESEELKAKYDEQLHNVRNNREYESLSKEVEYQDLEIQLANKKIKEAKEEITSIKKQTETTQKNLEEKKEELLIKKKELQSIEKETEKEEKDLIKKSEEIAKNIEPRLLAAYKRIRLNARNGLAVVRVERDACGGCFNKVPPQRQVDIRSHKKIIVCEHCGRLLIDRQLSHNILEELGGKFKEILKKELEEEKRLLEAKEKKGRSRRTSRIKK